MLQTRNTINKNPISCKAICYNEETKLSLELFRSLSTFSIPSLHDQTLFYYQPLMMKYPETIYRWNQIQKPFLFPIKENSREWDNIYNVLHSSLNSSSYEHVGIFKIHAVINPIVWRNFINLRENILLKEKRRSGYVDILFDCNKDTRITDNKDTGITGNKVENKNCNGRNTIVNIPLSKNKRILQENKIINYSSPMAWH